MSAGNELYTKYIDIIQVVGACSSTLYITTFLTHIPRGKCSLISYVRLGNKTEKYLKSVRLKLNSNLLTCKTSFSINFDIDLID